MKRIFRAMDGSDDFAVYDTVNDKFVTFDDCQVHPPGTPRAPSLGSARGTRHATQTRDPGDPRHDHPTIHLNGTSGDHLLDAHTAARSALRAALAALDECAPNARDYYPQGDGAFRAAVREHEARVEALRGVDRDLAALAEHIADAATITLTGHSHPVCT